MKKIWVLSLILLLIPVHVYAEDEEETPEPTPTIDLVGPDINAPSGILIDEETGTILAKKDPTKHLPTTGLAKTMGVYLATEKLKDNEEVKMSTEAFNSYDHRTNVIWVMDSESIPAIDLEHAAIMQNANDCMAMLAEKVGGSAEGFINQMNDKAQELEMKNTYYQNIFGFDGENNYTSAEDLAIITRKALRNDSFRSAYSTTSYRIAPTAMQVNERILAANCEMIRSGEDHYEFATGCQVGYSQEGGYSVSVEANKDDTNLIAVVLGASTEKTAYQDAKTLLEYGFANYQTITITPTQIGTKEFEVNDGNKHIADVTFSVDNAFKVLLPKSIDPSSLVVEVKTKNETSSNPDDLQAEVIFKLDGKQVGSSEMKKEVKMVGVEVEEKSRPLPWMIIDWISIAFLGFLILRQLGKMLRPDDKHLEGTQE